MGLCTVTIRIIRIFSYDEIIISIYNISKCTSILASLREHRVNSITLIFWYSHKDKPHMKNYNDLEIGRLIACFMIFTRLLYSYIINLNLRMDTEKISRVLKISVFRYVSYEYSIFRFHPIRNFSDIWYSVYSRKFELLLDIRFDP